MVNEGRLLNTEMGVRIVMGIIVWVSMTIMPSLAQENPYGLPICWAKMDDCATNAMIDVGDPAASYAICCPVIKPQVANTTCFCSIKDYVKNIPNDQPAVLSAQFEVIANKALSDCKFDTTFDQLCNGVSKSENEGMKNGAMKMIATVTLLPGSLFVWMMIISSQ